MIRVLLIIFLKSITFYIWNHIFKILEAVNQDSITIEHTNSGPNGPDLILFYFTQLVSIPILGIMAHIWSYLYFQNNNVEKIVNIFFQTLIVIWDQLTFLVFLELDSKWIYLKMKQNSGI